MRAATRLRGRDLQYHASVKRKKIKPRNPYVSGAKQRSGAGPMADRRTPRGGSHNVAQDDAIQSGLEEWETEAEQRESGSESADTEGGGEG